MAPTPPRILSPLQGPRVGSGLAVAPDSSHQSRSFWGRSLGSALRGLFPMHSECVVLGTSSGVSLAIRSVGRAKAGAALPVPAAATVRLGAEGRLCLQRGRAAQNLE